MSVPDVNGDVRAALQLGMSACTAYGRPDLATRLSDTGDQLVSPDVQIVAVGEFKQGKSSLVNALVNVSICPVDDDIATAVHTMVGYGEEVRAYALVKPAGDPDGEGRRIEITPSEIRSYATEGGDLDPALSVKAVEIELPRRLLQDGVILIDTPGVGGLGSAHAAAGMGALSIADAALFISDASQEFTRTEMEFLAQAVELCPSVACVLTKIDLYPRWREVLELNRAHLARRGVDVPYFGVSSTLRVEALKRKDKELNTHSGFPVLVQHVSDLVEASANRIRQRARHDLVSVCDQLAAQLEAQRQALSDPQASAELVTGLERAKAEAESLRSQAARWSTTLTDGIADLTSDVEFDLRGRIRTLQAEADASIENFDPIDTWDEFEPWLANAISELVVANYRLLTERSAALSLDVAGHFDIGRSELVARLDIRSAAGLLERVTVDTDLDLEPMGFGSKGLTALRGSYSGFLMVSLLGGLLGVAALALPVGLGAGAVLGRKSLKDEKERALARRRTDARNAVRRYCDEVAFQVGKDSRDTLRRVQRQLRDHYSDRADELNRSTAEALRSATEAANVAEADRSKRLRDVKAELERIDGLRARAEALVPAPGSSE